MISGIYTISHLPTGRAYVGSAVNIRRRWHMHRHCLAQGKHHCQKLQRAWHKYGAEEFLFSVLVICGKADLVANEQIAIDALDAVKCGFNTLAIAGSSLGFKHTAATRAKLSALRMGKAHQFGRPASPEMRAKIGAANRGRVASPEARARLSASRAGKTPALGMKHSPEARAKMSAARMGKRRTPESIAAGRATRCGYRHSVETRAKISAAAKARPGKKRGPYRNKLLKINLSQLRKTAA